MNTKWECFTILTHLTPPSPGQVVELLEQVESQGYEPKFLQVAQQGCQIFGRKKLIAEETENLKELVTGILSPESEPLEPPKIELSN